MTSKKNELFKSMMLSGVFLGAFAILGITMVLAMHHATDDKIAWNQQQSLLENLQSVIPASLYDNDILASTLQVSAEQLLGEHKPVIVYRAFNKNKPVALAFNFTALEGYSGEIKLLIGIDYQGNILNVRVIEHKETPGLGDKIEKSRSDWIDTFQNTSLQIADKHWKVKKDGGQFDQFTGATITPRAVVKAVYQALQYFEKNRHLLFVSQQQYEQLSQVKP